MRREIKIVRDGYGEKYVTHLASEERRAIGKEDMASLYAPRTEIASSGVNEGHDRAHLIVGGQVYFAGIIEDVVRNDDTSEIIVESWERLAERAEPTSGVDEWDNAPDRDIILDALADVPELEPGGIAATNGSVSLLFSHASQAFKIRKTADVSPGIVRYNPDKTVDYGELGQNKTHVTLSPRRENVEKDFEIERKSSYEEVTHLRMLGAGEGDAQIEALAIADDYDDGEQIWKVYADKGIAEQGTLQDKAEHFVEELKTSIVDVELTVKGIRCELGDVFRVYIPSEDLEEHLQVVEHKRVIDTEGIKHELTLSNHRDTREDPEEKNRADLEHYNSAIEGNTVPINATGGRQPVNADHNYVAKVYYPSEVAHEHRLNIRVMGLPYRAYSAGAVDNADFESAVVAETTANIGSTPSNWETLSSLEPEEDTSFLTAHTAYEVNIGDTDDFILGTAVRFRLRVRRDDGSTVYIPDEDGFVSDTHPQEEMQSSVWHLLPENVEGYLIELQAMTESSFADEMGMVSRTHWQGAGRHTHDPDPGIIETFPGNTQHYPSNCNVLINGESVGTAFGDGGREFTESVDIRGELTEGDVNEIEVTSDSLGHCLVFVEGDVFRVVRGRG